MTDSSKIPIHVTHVGQRYVKVEDLLRNESVRETLKKMTDLSEKYTQKSESEAELKQKEK